MEMDYEKLKEESASYVRLVLPLMSQYDIPMTPKNYTVWYDYVSGTNVALRETIDSMLARGGPFTQDANEKLYRQFCGGDDEEGLKEFRENLRDLLVNILSKVAEVSGQAGAYESIITKSVGKLADNTSIKDIRNVVGEIIVKTREMGKTGSDMQQRLKEATLELEVLREEFEQAKTEALVDFLTGVANRKAFDETLTTLAGEAYSGHDHLSLLLVDIDHFKDFNDKHGHLVGDQVLKFVSKSITEIVRGRDFVARYGGEEFAVILPETMLKGAKSVAENIRLHFAKGRLKKVKTLENLGNLTVSVGAAQYRSGEATEDLISRSDQSLYLAKRTGRNRVATELELENQGG